MWKTTCLVCGRHAHVEHAVVQLVSGGVAEAAAAAARVAVVAAAVDDHDHGTPGNVLAAAFLVVATAEPLAQVHHAQGEVGVDRAEVLADAAELLGALKGGVSLSMGHGLDRLDPPTHVDRLEILTRP